MQKAAVITAVALLGTLASTEAQAGWRGYGYGYAPTTTYTYSETRYGGGYRDVGFDDEEYRPAYRTRRVVREVYESGPRYSRHRGYSWGGPDYRSVDIDDED